MAVYRFTRFTNDTYNLNTKKVFIGKPCKPANQFKLLGSFKKLFVLLVVENVMNKKYVLRNGIWQVIVTIVEILLVYFVNLGNQIFVS